MEDRTVRSTVYFERALHKTLRLKADFLAIITAYVPSEEEWDESFRLRKRR